ncbi:MAG: hypothetical protein M3349_02550 [Actinomycetota bacterium]|nr:hypothetical protein [Actinomycetota bacterium]
MAGNRERGEMGVGIMLAVAATFVVAVAVVHAFMFLYGQAVVRSALDEAVRAASRVDGDPALCEERAGEVKGDLLGGSLGDEVSFSCVLTGGELVAAADVTFDSPMPGVPSLSFQLEATATQEVPASP